MSRAVKFIKTFDEANEEENSKTATVPKLTINYINKCGGKAKGYDDAITKGIH